MRREKERERERRLATIHQCHSQTKAKRYYSLRSLPDILTPCTSLALPCMQQSGGLPPGSMKENIVRRNIRHQKYNASCSGKVLSLPIFQLFKAVGSRERGKKGAWLPDVIGAAGRFAVAVFPGALRDGPGPVGEQLVPQVTRETSRAVWWRGEKEKT